MQALCMPHLKIKPVSFDCGASRSTLSISFYQMMQPMQPRFVLQQAVPRQPVVLSHARPAQPWLGQLQQLPAQVRPAAGRMAPAAMPPPIVKDMAKPGARPLRWVYAAPMLRNRGCSTNPKVILPFSKVVPTKVIGPEQKELPKQAGVEEMPHRLKSFGNLASSGSVKSQNVNLSQLVLPPVPKATGGVHADESTGAQRAPCN